MNKKNVIRLVGGALGGTAGVVGGISIVSGRYLSGVLILILGIGGLYVYKRKFLGKYIDERDYLISEKSARRTVQITGLVLGLSSVVLLGLTNTDQGNYTQAGYALGYATCFLLLTKLLSYYYYRKKNT